MLASMEARREQGAPSSCIPKIRLSTAQFTVNRGDALKPRYEDVELPVIALSFGYDGYEVEASDPDVGCFADNDTDLELGPPRSRARCSRKRKGGCAAKG